MNETGCARAFLLGAQVFLLGVECRGEAKLRDHVQ